MNIKDEILGIPRAVEAMLERTRPEYEAAIRRAKWSEGLMHFVGEGAGRFAALRGALAFEASLGWPAIARSRADFQAYTLPTLHPRSQVIFVSSNDKAEETSVLASRVKSRGAFPWMLGADPPGAFAEWTNVAKDEGKTTGEAPSIQKEYCRHVAVEYLAITAAGILKGPQSQEIKSLQEEFQALPERLDWILTHLSDSARTLAAEFSKTDSACVVGGGFYQVTAFEAAGRLETATGRNVQSVDASDFNVGALPRANGRNNVLLLSGSQCRVKQLMHSSARDLHQAGLKFISITDSNDRELVSRSEMAILLPEIGESLGSLMALALLDLAAFFAARESRAASK
jgi:glucosamine 6-phosphate synthetase-like amidotransferase/phosphosugar isomerase protein